MHYHFQADYVVFPHGTADSNLKFSHYSSESPKRFVCDGGTTPSFKFYFRRLAVNGDDKMAVELLPAVQDGRSGPGDLWPLPNMAAVRALAGPLPTERAHRHVRGDGEERETRKLSRR